MLYWILTLRDALREPVARGAVRSACLLLVSGVLFYVLVEGWTVVDALYFCVTTLTTVGFGEPAPTTDVGKLFTVFFMVSGIGMFLAVINSIGRSAVKKQIQGLDRAGRRHGHGQEPAASSHKAGGAAPAGGLPGEDRGLPEDV